jgi:antitoxin (DNA-binding transcriptional repressor) of toxin-antitoxin stability system
MKIASIRELKHQTSTVLSWVENGESVEVQRYGKPIAILSPKKAQRKNKRPDFLSRIRSDYGNQILPSTGTELMEDSRGEK